MHRFYEKEYHILYKQLVGYWGYPEEKEKMLLDPELEYQYDVYSVFQYPIFKGKIRDTHFKLEFVDNTGEPYFSIQMTYDKNHGVRIEHENIIRTFFKMIKLNHENEITNTEFNKKYYVETKFKEDKELINNTAFQSAVIACEPFFTIRMKPFILYLDFRVDKINNQSIPLLQSYLEKATQLAKSI